MDLSMRVIEQVIHPTAAFARASCDDAELSEPPGLAHEQPWADSRLNPKNRIDSLALPRAPYWRIDGCAGLGTQYYAVPLFIPNAPPMRMDVFIPYNLPIQIREQLDLNAAFHTKDAARLSRLAITRLIIRKLQHWVTEDFEDLDTFERFYRSIPFGSRIVFENLSLDNSSLDIHQIRLKVGMNHDLERQLLSVSSLRSFWGDDFSFPPAIDFYDVHVIQVLHDSVCIVRIYGELFIFKALTGGEKYLYHELKTLCTLAPHSHVIVRPIHIVQKKANFGSKKAVVGFTTFYHAKGSLRDLLPQRRIHGQLQRADQLKWSIQLTTALEHLRTSTETYYPDLRLDNIVLSEQEDIVMVDFEQRGVWCEFAAPEVNAVEYIRFVAIADDEDLGQVPMEIKKKYQAKLEQLVPGFEALEGRRYTNPDEGYNLSWIALTAAEKEAAEVYMLGRVLWCIFEGVSGPQKAAVWQSYRWESDLEFPEYDRTPPVMRTLIDRCTRGRRETLGSIITRQHSQLVLRDRPLGDQTADDVQEAARKFWRDELVMAEKFLWMRDFRHSQGQWDGNYYARPTLKEVLTTLQAYQKEVG
ncbi:hypothetical protein F4778DRAFT_770945 [Xylariomycetidae sp. FL2044]|nr:hypothetical protein F4778DRAFT_770945 [Xylariomycetidae sp. FL2044]